MVTCIFYIRYLEEFFFLAQIINPENLGLRPHLTRPYVTARVLMSSRLRRNQWQPSRYTPVGLTIKDTFVLFILKYITKGQKCC